MKARYKSLEVIKPKSGGWVHAIKFDTVTDPTNPGTLELSEDDAAKLAWDLLCYLPEDVVKKIRGDL